MFRHGGSVTQLGLDGGESYAGASMRRLLMNAKGKETPVPPADESTRAHPQESVQEISKRWTLTRPMRNDILTSAIYAVLEGAYKSGEPRPSPRVVMGLCIKKNPHDVLEVTHDEIKFYDRNGDTETATVDAVRKRIERMTTMQADDRRTISR